LVRIRIFHRTPQLGNPVSNFIHGRSLGHYELVPRRATGAKSFPSAPKASSTKFTIARPINTGLQLGHWQAQGVAVANATGEMARIFPPTAIRQERQRES
jgi:hypothetical protein